LLLSGVREVADSTPKNLTDQREKKSKALKANAITATRLVTSPVIAEADAALDLALTKEETVEMTGTATTGVAQDLDLMIEETTAAETIEIEETITEREITIGKTNVRLVALDLTKEPTVEEVEIETEETVKKENSAHPSNNVDLRSVRENNVPRVEVAVREEVKTVVREDDPTQLLMKERRGTKAPHTSKSRDPMKVNKNTAKTSPGNNVKSINSKLLRKTTENEFE